MRNLGSRNLTKATASEGWNQSPRRSHIKALRSCPQQTMTKRRLYSVTLSTHPVWTPVDTCPALRPQCAGWGGPLSLAASPGVTYCHWREGAGTQVYSLFQEIWPFSVCGLRVSFSRYLLESVFILSFSIFFSII